MLWQPESSVSKGAEAEGKDSRRQWSRASGMAMVTV